MEDTFIYCRIVIQLQIYIVYKFNTKDTSIAPSDQPRVKHTAAATTAHRNCWITAKYSIYIATIYNYIYSYGYGYR